MASNAWHENSATFARTSGLTCFEGFALVPDPTLFDHARCVNADGHVYEVTWG